MLLLAGALVAGLAAGAALGGELRRLARVRLAGWPWLLAGLVAQAVGLRLGGPAYRIALLAGLVPVGVVVVRNRWLVGVPVVALGLALNAAVGLANGAMPVSAAAARRAGVAVDQVAAGAVPGRVLTGPGTRLPLLADVVALPLPLRPEVVSPGDLVVALGLGLLVVSGMRRARPGVRRRHDRLGGWRSGHGSGGHGPGARPITASGRTPDRQLSPRAPPR